MKSCIFFLADGAREDVFRELLVRGALPNIARYVVDCGTYAPSVSVFPSTTGPAYAPFLLGKFPGRCNLPGIRWFDRYRYAKETFSLLRMRSYVGFGSLLMQHDISKEHPTVFELLPRSASILNELNRGLSWRGNKTGIMGSWYKVRANYDHSWDKVDEYGIRRLCETLREDLSFIYCVFTAIDHYSHLLHPFHKKVIDSYIRMDDALGRVAKELSRQGRLDETLIIISSDHGLTQTHTHFDSVEFMMSQGYKTLRYPVIFKHWRDADAANMISGNAMTHLYVKSPEGWERSSTFEELGVLVERLLNSDGVDIVAGKDACGRVRIKSLRGEAVAWLDEEGKVRYETIGGGDPFGYNEMPREMTTQEALTLSVDTRYPDGILQILQLFESPRCGDLVVSAKEGYDLRVRYENPEHRSSHGALIREHMLVPFAISKKVANRPIRTVDIFPTLLEFLEVAVPPGVDGRSLL
jgi:hypothetical protein